MLSKEKNFKKDNYFNLPTEDRIDFEIESKEKEEKEMTTENIFKKLDEKSK